MTSFEFVTAFAMLIITALVSIRLWIDMRFLAIPFTALFFLSLLWTVRFSGCGGGDDL